MALTPCKPFNGDWEEVSCTLVDTTHSSNSIACYKNENLKLAFVSGIAYSFPSSATGGDQTIFRGLPEPIVPNVRVNLTDATNKANVGYIKKETGTNNTIFTAYKGNDSYLCFTCVYPYK